MKKTKITKLCFSIFMLTIVLFVSACSSNDDFFSQLTSDFTVTDASLEINILDIGKSDCIIIETDDHTVMIDTGLDEYSYQVIEFLNYHEIEKIDYLIITHLDQDHIGGVSALLDEVTIEQIIQPNYTRNTSHHQNYVDSLSAHNIEPIYLEENFSLTINDAVLTIYAPLKENYDESNDYSLITSLAYASHLFLFAGDAEEVRLNEFLATNESEYTIVKLPHHGIYAANLEDFLISTNPTHSIITCSEDSQPDVEVLKMLADHNIQTFLTSDGAITIRVSEDNLSFTQEINKFTFN